MFGWRHTRRFGDGLEPPGRADLRADGTLPTLKREGDGTLIEQHGGR